MVKKIIFFSIFSLLVNTTLPTTPLKDSPTDINGTQTNTSPLETSIEENEEYDFMDQLADQQEPRPQQESSIILVTAKTVLLKCMITFMVAQEYCTSLWTKVKKKVYERYNK